MSEAKHLRELIKAKKGRLHQLELKEARYGLEVPPHIPIEIKQLQSDIEGLQTQLAALEKKQKQELKRPEEGDRPVSAPDKPRWPVNWEKMGAIIAGVIAVLVIGGVILLVIRGSVPIATSVPSNTMLGKVVLLLEVIAALALLIKDVLAVFSIFSSAWMLAGESASLASGRRRYEASEQILFWAWGGLILGTIGLASLVITGNEAEQIGVIFRLSKSTIGILLFVSFLLLSARRILPLIIRRKGR
jgi:hypothetical protein